MARVYIVYIGGRPKSDISVLALHISMLQNFVGRLGRLEKSFTQQAMGLHGLPPECYKRNF
ncbi:hypothetical protein SADUNF_Sadunf10G0150600 [Salix dunnii]|uniref:Uncharacterized protein n=1 Tax=Salix dunnii TaxID=1413687 RepID=A0A835JW96_9ROSI|nr:hypothetical protein SADUNF_Sadunf10G0150600 [Salix dunnii]